MAIFVDGACNKHTVSEDGSIEAWATVVDEKGINLLSKYPELCKDFNSKIVNTPKGEQTVIVAKFNDVAYQQNNGAELISLLVGLRIALSTKNYKVINTDSELCYKWWSVGHVSTNSKRKMDSNKLFYINECARLRKEFELTGGKIVKISGDDNLADIGYHK